LVLEPVLAQAAGLSVSVRQVDSGAQVTLAAASPLRYSLRHLDNPHRLIVDLAGLRVAASGTQEVSVPPVRSIRIAQGRGFAQVVVVVLVGPVQADVAASGDGKTLALRLRGVEGRESRLESKSQTASSPRPSPPSGQAPALPSGVTVPVPSPVPAEAVRLQHVRAMEVAEHLRRLLPDLVARADESTNTLLLSGPQGVLQQARQIIGVLDQPAPTQPVTEAVPLKVVRAQAIAPVLQAMFPQSQIRAEPTTNSVLITAPRRLVEPIKAVIAALDVVTAPSPTAPVTEAIRLQHADPMEVARLISAVLSGTRVRVDHGTRMLTIVAPPAVLQQAKALIQQLDQPSPTAPVSEVIRVRQDPGAVAAVLRQAVPQVTVTPDRNLGAVIVAGPRAEVERARAILQSLEAQQAQPSPAQLRVEVVPLKHTMPSEFVQENATSRTGEELAQTILASCLFSRTCTPLAWLVVYHKRRKSGGGYGEGAWRKQGR
jgi:type II secretory pathway component GspD/PulD (secretin)